MKVAFINTYDVYGGAAIACNRVFQAVRQAPAITSAKLLVQQKDSQDANVLAWSTSFLGRKKAFLRFALERFYFLQFAKDRSVQYAFSPANLGIDISKHPLIQEADIIHLHWTTFGFLSLKSLDKLAQLGKPVVWTLHDMWAFTGGCHYTGECTNFHVSCGNCQFLKRPRSKDISYKIFQKKFKIFHQLDLHVVTSSHWLGQEAQQSSLFKRSINSSNQVSIQTIPTPIDIEAFKPVAKAEIRSKLKLNPQKFQVLFGAMNIADQRKGFKYFEEALQILKSQYPDLNEQMELLIFGKASPELLAALPYPVNNLGVLSGSEQMSQAYNAADLFIIPSLEDNLPNTIIEALACGTPTVAFHTGGIPDMIYHQHNGYLAQYKDAKDLAKGIHWALAEADYVQLSQNAHQKALDNFTESAVAHQYIQLYQKVLAQKNKPNK
ncbi:MAG TPA: glycosyl transferase family 1 [Microscillaceae bacterium]|nr:glycosyl transferase family 1 [Microscillaceae bacterium]